MQFGTIIIETLTPLLPYSRRRPARGEGGGAGAGPQDSMGAGGGAEYRLFYESNSKFMANFPVYFLCILHKIPPKFPGALRAPDFLCVPFVLE